MKNIIPVVWIGLIRMNYSAIEILETLDGGFLKYSDDPELLDVIAHFRERVSSKFDRKEQHMIVGEYWEFLRREFRYNPERFKLTEEYMGKIDATGEAKEKELMTV